MYSYSHFLKTLHLKHIIIIQDVKGLEFFQHLLIIALS